MERLVEAVCDRSTTHDEGEWLTDLSIRRDKPSGGGVALVRRVTRSIPMIFLATDIDRRVLSGDNCYFFDGGELPVEPP